MESFAHAKRQAECTYSAVAEDGLKHTDIFDSSAAELIGWEEWDVHVSVHGHIYTLDDKDDGNDWTWKNIFILYIVYKMKTLQQQIWKYS